MFLDRASTRLVSVDRAAIWAKKILQWSRTSEDHDRIEQDPNSSARNLLVPRAIRPAVGTRRAHFGTWRSMRSDNTARKVDVRGDPRKYGEKENYGPGTKTSLWAVIETSRCSVATFKLRNSPFFRGLRGAVNVRKY
jgi:hypothetical protein